MIAPPRAIRSQRVERCGGCSLPRIACLCDELPHLRVRTRVVVVMHRREALRSSNTGQLAVKILANAARAVRGELGPRVIPDNFGGKQLVLFPQEGARELRSDDATDDLVLVVPDGTWSQAKRVLRREPIARDGEVVRLPPCAPTRYTLRRNTRDGALCTLEAIAAALGILEGGDVQARLLACFDAFQARALEVRGRRAKR